MCERGNVDLNHLQLARKLCLREFSTESKSGVVDKDINRGVLVVKEIEDRLGCFATAQVRRENMHSYVVFSFDLTGRSLE